MLLGRSSIGKNFRILKYSDFVQKLSIFNMYWSGDKVGITDVLSIALEKYSVNELSDFEYDIIVRIVALSGEDVYISAIHPEKIELFSKHLVGTD